MRVQTRKLAPTPTPWMWDDNEWETVQDLQVEEAKREDAFAERFEHSYLANGDEE